MFDYRRYSGLERGRECNKFEGKMGRATGRQDSVVQHHQLEDWP